MRNNNLPWADDLPWGKYLMWGDEETGEIKGAVSFFRKKSGLPEGGWIAVMQEALAWLAEQNLPNEQYRVLMFLMSKLDWENYLRITQRSIAEALDMKQPHVSRAMKALVSRGIIIEGPRMGNNKTYRLDPHMAMKGRRYKQTVIEFDALRKQQQRQSQSPNSLGKRQKKRR